MNCPKCEMNLIDGAKFCGSCGFTIAPEMPPVAAARPIQALGTQETTGAAFRFDTDGRGQGFP